MEQLGSKMQVAEVYSPPRITQIAEKIGLNPWWSLDLTVDDPEDGQPWDFAQADKRERTRQLLSRQRPLFLIRSVMCIAWSSWQ